MKVSIITVSFNQRRYLEQNRASVKAQGADLDVEHIIVDPGSTDGSRELIRSWNDADVVPVFESDQGPADGLNHGLDRVSGGIWLYLNADDELAPGAVKKVLKAHECRPEAGVVIGNGWTIGEEGQSLSFVRSDRFTPARYAMGVGTVLQQGTSFKTGRFGLRFNPLNRYNWDTELLFDAYREGVEIAYTDEVIGYFRLQPESITMSGKYEAGIRSERMRLIRTVAGSKLLRAVSPFARAAKRANSVRHGSPVFEGVAR